MIKKLKLNPNEMAVRKVYWPLVEKKEISTFFRPGVRLGTDFRGYCEKQIINLRCIERLGYDQLDLAPQLSESKKFEISIAKIYSKKIKELNRSDFIGSSPDVHNITSLKFHLGLIYNLSLDEIDDEFYVTVININYEIENKKCMKIKPRLENLLQNGMWEIAKLPPENSQDLDSDELMVTLISHDYPARTPLLWNRAFKHFNIPAKSIVLVPGTDGLDKEILKWTLNLFEEDSRFKAGGLGVGLKDESMEFISILDDSAANVGASNFISKNEEGKLVAYNTDGTGFAQGLGENFSHLKDLSDKKVLLLGSGGTANAIAFALAKVGAKLIIANRTKSKAISLAKEINNFYLLRGEKQTFTCGEDKINDYLADIDLVVNASTKGAEGKLSDYSALARTDLGLDENLRLSQDYLKLLPENCVVSDIVLRLKDTPLVSQAKKAGLKTMDGLPMVISQAALAFTLSYGNKLNIKFSEAYKVMKDIV